MKGKKEKKVNYISIKIREEHYNLVKENKSKSGVNIDFFVGKAIEEKIEREKK